jgi:copper chaperone
MTGGMIVVEKSLQRDQVMTLSVAVVNIDGVAFVFHICGYTIEVRMKFRTNIKCDACVAKVTPVLNEAVGAGNWSVDLLDPNRTLSLDHLRVSTAELKSRLAMVGYQADEISVA